MERTPQERRNKEILNSIRWKGVKHAVDDMCHPSNFVDPGIGQRLHDGWGRSHPPGHRHRRGAGPSYPGTKTFLADSPLAGEGEVFRKEVVSRP